MKIMLVHNYYQQAGGEDRSFEAERQMLIDNGHDVISYTRHNDEIKSMNNLIVAMKTIWNRATTREIRELLKREQPAVMHCTNTFPLISPSIYFAAKRAGVPVVQSLRNYRAFCVNSSFYRGESVCESCFKRSVAWSGILHGCYRDSRTGSAVVAANQFLHRTIRTWQRKIDCFFSPTEFTRQKFIEGGFDGDRIFVKPNFLTPDPGTGNGMGNYGLFIGRLSPEKGLDTLLAAWQGLGSRLPLKVVGDGPSRNLVAQADQAGEIEWLGQRDPASVIQLIKDATMVVVPSRWYETFGRVIMESFACGTPAVVADHGAMRELVDHNVNGKRFRPGDADHLRSEVLDLLDSPEQLQQMRIAARQEFLEKYTAETNYQNLMKIYEAAIAGNHLRNDTLSGSGNLPAGKQVQPALRR